MRDFLAATRDRVIVFDGGMGATLEQFDLSLEHDYKLPGRCHEALILNRPDVIEGVHASMVEAGAEVVETDTFQASRLKLEEWGLAEYTTEINVKAAQIARKAVGEDRFVAGSIGPTGFLPASEEPSLGQIRFRELVAIFREQAAGLLQGGVDLLIVETAQDILEVKASIFGIREAFKDAGRKVPIQASVSLLPNGGKMLLGTDVNAALTTLEALKVDVIGLNCSTGPEDMRDAIRFLGEHSPVPVHCIPNAGIPHQGPDGETVFPEQPGPLAESLGEFVERYGVSIVGGCCGTTPEHIRAIAERCASHPISERPSPRTPHVSSMIAAAPLVQEPAPTIVGERVNSQGSRKAKELLLADDYDGLLQVAEDQVEGGAHVLDLCVALTERTDEDEQMRLVAKKVSLTQPAPIQVDSTEPEVIATALDQIPGRAIVNSVNLEAGEDKLNTVVPIAMEHGAALIALTIDEVGMAKTRERKLEIARRITDLVCNQHGMDPELLIFDALTFTLTTGDEEWKPSAVETIEGIRLIKQELPGVKTSLGVSNVSFGIGLAARSVLNSVFLSHCVEAGLDLAMVNPNHITPYSEIPDVERELADDLVFNRREDALERFIAHFESKGPEAEADKADPTAEMEPEAALHWHILRRKKEGVEAQIDKSVEKIGAVPTLNDVLLPAMKEVGDKFGAGELILPFVLQSAEVMKRAVAQLEQYLDKLEGYTKGTVVLATVFGDVHDIGKSLVNTILTNNGYTVIDLGKQVPIQTILDAAKEHDATAIGLSALLVSTSKQMPLAVQELHSQGLEYPVLLGGAAINRKFALRALYPNGKEDDTVYGPGVFYCQDAFEGLAVMDRLIEGDKREALVQEVLAAGAKLRETGEEEEVLDTSDDSVRSAVRTDVPVPTPPFWGVREIEVDMEELYTQLDTHVLFKLHWGGRGVKGEEWKKLLNEDFRPRLERMWASADYLHPRALLGYFPCYSEGNDIVVLDPSDRETVLTRFTCPRQPKNDRLCLADFYRPKDSGELDVVAVQAVTVGDEVTELMAKLEAEGEFAEQLFVHGLGVQTAEGLAEWLHWRVRNDLSIPVTQGRRYSWGYPAVPDQSEHLKVEQLLGLEQIGMTISDGYAPIPEQSTLAIVAHHPQATYYGMRNGRLLVDGSPDDVIRGTPRDPSTFADSEALTS
ncbi:homocysteine S-methyltransferase family protein [Solirubrobacter sp. CPCC 204708]|uniref:Methionine synthase n=1 Tax=Solirubrobacter deserti TaxID=2282478 RepID=A0ABT4RG07_9ACTN|nr:homocysteine S-methyltransferase family protein [Solirubrobacter deserti]MBE2318194.1 homocysteine S-methyltransferase family protein [Solirubrobacter deserti]MDA0137475.1 homocysteine S-methyltransferase family protein [Solirubrobacter deserti]